jgi:hypothetical protein
MIPKVILIFLQGGPIREWRHDRLARLVYQPSINSKQISHQQSVSSIFISERISTGHQPLAQRTGRMTLRRKVLLWSAKDTKVKGTGIYELYRKQIK